VRLEEQRSYWDREAANACFALDFDHDEVLARVPLAARVLDFGCGYGRSLETLARAGYGELVGLDPSGEMIARAKQRVPQANFEIVSALPTDLHDASFDLILLIAVLTCVPDDERQRDVMREVSRLLAPGGLVCVSDFLILENDRNRARYRASHPGPLPYGVFVTEDQMQHRHHTSEWIDDLLSPFSRVAYREAAVETRRGNPGLAFEYIGEQMM